MKSILTSSKKNSKFLKKNRKGSDSTKDSVDGKGNVRGKEENGPAKAKLTALLEHTRLRNIAICTRKLPSMPIPDLIKAINSLDIETVNEEAIELLQRMVPNEEEIKAYRNFDAARKEVNELTEEDKVMR